MVSPAALIDTLRRRHASERQVHAERAERLRKTLATWVQEGQHSGLFTRAWLIGSLTTNHFGSRSDVDLVVEQLDATRAGEWWAALCHALDCEVDLLELERLPATFAERVLREGKLFDAA